MVFFGIAKTEAIWFTGEGDATQPFSIEMYRSANDPNYFSVSCKALCKEWYYEFESENSADYERVKYCIMEAGFNNSNPENLLSELSDIFEDEFYGIMVKEEEEE